MEKLIKESFEKTKEEIVEQKKWFIAFMVLILMGGVVTFLLPHIDAYLYMLQTGEIIPIKVQGFKVTFIWLGEPALWKIPFVFSFIFLLAVIIFGVVDLFIAGWFFGSKIIKHLIIGWFNNRPTKSNEER